MISLSLTLSLVVVNVYVYICCASSLQVQINIAFLIKDAIPSILLAHRPPVTMTMKQYTPLHVAWRRSLQDDVRFPLHFNTQFIHLDNVFALLDSLRV